MRTRNGFVSNSSSSSFVLVTTQENWKKVRQEVHPYQAAVAEAIQSKPQEAFGHTLIKFSTFDNQDSSWSEYLELDYDGEIPDKQNVGKAWYVVKKKLLEGDCITHDQDVG